MWEYIKTPQPARPWDKRTIVADDKLRAVFGKDSKGMLSWRAFWAITWADRSYAQPQRTRHPCRPGSGSGERGGGWWTADPWWPQARP